MDGISSKQQVRNSNSSVSKAMAILRFLGEADTPQTITEISRNVGVTASSCHDLVTTLLGLGMIQASMIGKSYELGARLVRLAKLALMSPTGHWELQHAMSIISDKYDLNLSIFQPFGELSYVSTQVSEGSSPIRIRLSPGQHFPIFRGASGKLFAAYRVKDPKLRKEALRQIEVGGSKPSKDFEGDVAKDFALGHSVDRGRTQRGVAAIAVPIVINGGELIGTIEFVMFEKRFDVAPIQGIVNDGVKLATFAAACLMGLKT